MKTSTTTNLLNSLTLCTRTLAPAPFVLLFCDSFPSIFLLAYWLLVVVHNTHSLFGKCSSFFLFLLRCVNDFYVVFVCAFFKQILIQRVSSAFMLLFLCSFFVGCYDCFDF